MQLRVEQERKNRRQKYNELSSWLWWVAQRYKRRIQRRSDIQSSLPSWELETYPATVSQTAAIYIFDRVSVKIRG